MQTQTETISNVSIISQNWFTLTFFSEELFPAKEKQFSCAEIYESMVPRKILLYDNHNKHKDILSVKR